MILTLNAGSSSIKFARFRWQELLPQQPDLVGQIDGIGTALHFVVRDGAGSLLADLAPEIAGGGDHRRALEHLLAWLDAKNGEAKIRAVGHRVVHGGEEFYAPVLIDDAVVERIGRLAPLAPLHQVHNLAGIAAMRRALPHVPQVACFDTAFHHSQDELAQRYALPAQLTARGLRRYGFHGLSYEYIAAALPAHLHERAEGRVIVAHLGNGASMCALRGRQSVATTMGFSTIEGLMMGTRCGNLDPGVLLYLMDNLGMTSAALAQLLYKESGLLGVSGVSNDMRVLLESPAPGAALAVDLFCYRCRREIGSLAAAAGGMDALVFTGGIGEHAAPVRTRICAELGWLGVALDEAANAAPRRDARAIHSGATAVWVMPTNEEWMIARHTAREGLRGV